MDWAEGVVASVTGDIHVKLKKLMKDDQDMGMRIETTIPDKTTSRVYVPCFSSENFVIYVNDSIIWNDGKFIDVNNQISFDSKSNEFIVFEFQPGNYVIKAVDDEVF